MHLFGLLLLIALLISVVVQDFKYRGVTWWIYPLLLLASALYSLNYLTWKDLLTNTFFNIGFITFQLVLLTLYFSVKNKRIVWVTKGYLGMGDILFFLIMAFLFSPGNYIIFYIASLFIVLIFSLFIKSFLKGNIPLAGMQAGVLVLIIIISEGCGCVRLSGEMPFYQILN